MYGRSSEAGVFADFLCFLHDLLYAAEPTSPGWDMVAGSKVSYDACILHSNQLDRILREHQVATEIAHEREDMSINRY